MKADAKYDQSVSLIRFIATIFIVTCHIMQYLDIELAWWFNVGVQMFLCMSGFLYGRRGIIENDVDFYLKNAKKILIDYYMVIVFVILLHAVFIPEYLSVSAVYRAFLTSATLAGGQHLWYISYCLLCYLITPFLSRYFATDKNNQLVKRFLVLSILTVLVMKVFFYSFNHAWIICYIIGFFLGKISKNEKRRLYVNISWIIVAGAIIFNAIQIVQDYIVHVTLSDRLASWYISFCDYAHVALGVSLFVGLRFIFSALFAKGTHETLKKLCAYSDKYSYDVYLVHQFVILGPLSLMSFTGSLGINIALILVIIAVSAGIVHFLSTCIRNQQERCKQI